MFQVRMLDHVIVKLFHFLMIYLETRACFFRNGKMICQFQFRYPVPASAYAPVYPLQRLPECPHKKVPIGLFSFKRPVNLLDIRKDNFIFMLVVAGLRCRKFIHQVGHFFKCGYFPRDRRQMPASPAESEGRTSYAYA